jgi:hypothetical protein
VVRWEDRQRAKNASGQFRLWQAGRCSRHGACGVVMMAAFEWRPFGFSVALRATPREHPPAGPVATMRWPSLAKRRAVAAPNPHIGPSHGRCAKSHKRPKTAPLHNKSTYPPKRLSDLSRVLKMTDRSSGASNNASNKNANGYYSVAELEDMHKTLERLSERFLDLVRFHSQFSSISLRSKRLVGI